VTDLNRPLLGEPNAPCRTCGAPLAADQRYCLQCGSRRAEARLPFLDILARQIPATAGAATVETRRTTGPAGVLGRMSSNSVVVAFIACLLLAMGVGVLIGGLGKDNGNASATPQVISVGGAAPAAATPSTATPAAPTGNAATTSTKSTKSKAKSSGASASKSKATNTNLKALDNSSTQDYQKKSAKLPKTLGTGGKAPPKDNKPAAGGGDFQTIG
jgi:hypothetical protein